MKDHIPKFSFNHSQDASEVLYFILEELCGLSISASNLFMISVRTEVSCDLCYTWSDSVEKVNYLDVPVRSTISEALCEKLKSKIISRY